MGKTPTKYFTLVARSPYRTSQHPYYSTGFTCCQEEIFSETKWSCLLIRFFGLQWGTLSCSLTLPLTVIIILEFQNHSWMYNIQYYGVGHFCPTLSLTLKVVRIVPYIFLEVFAFEHFNSVHLYSERMKHWTSQNLICFISCCE